MMLVMSAEVKKIGVMFILLWSVGCSTYDAKSTVQVSTYSPPTISQLSISESGIHIILTTDLYYPGHEDFSYFILLYGSPNVNFQSAIDSVSMGALTTVNQIPNYLAHTVKPAVSGNYFNPLTVSLELSNFQPLNTYSFAAIAYGYNETYGRLYENNGWLYSDTSLTHTLHIPIFTNGVITNGNVLAINGNNWEVSSNTTSKNSVIDFVFASNINNQQVDVMMAQGDLGINPLGYISQITGELPSSGYISGRDNYFVVIANHSYALRSITANTYARLYINSVDSLAGSISYKLVYSTVAGEREF